MGSNVYNNDMFVSIRELMLKSEFEKAYNLLKSIGEKCAEWYHLNGVSAMNIGYYEEGEKCIEKAVSMAPNNNEYKEALNSYNFHRDDYRHRANRYNKRRHNDLGGCCCCCCDDCCCCCGDDCCEDCMKLWCLDSCCECCGGDLVDCF
ncbi:MAG: hypothetical protein ACRDA3_12495 [Peptostreptococcaceae bacterium]